MSKTEFKSIPLTSFSSPDGTGKVTATGVAEFDSKVINAGAAIQKFNAGFEKGKDHWVRYVGATVEINDQSGNKVTFTATLTLSDDSDNFIKTHDLTVMIAASLE